MIAAPLGRLRRRARGLKVAGRMTVDWLRTGELRAPTEWSIGIYEGQSPFQLSPQAHNPVLTAREITDVDADFVADPFMIPRGDRWFMFFEVMNRRVRRGEIGMAMSQDGHYWDYQGIVLSADHHLSYPFVFSSGNEVFMVPEESDISAIRLFRARDFPDEWEPVQVIADGMPFEDATVFWARGRWWAIASTTSLEPDTTHVFHSENLTGEWIRHPAGGAGGRSAGRVVDYDGNLTRFVQKSSRVYGEAVHAHRIESLSPTSYVETITNLEVLGPSGVGWNAARMHTVDAHRLGSGRWLACVDGRGFSRMVARLDRILPVEMRPYEYPRANE